MGIMKKYWGDLGHRPIRLGRSCTQTNQRSYTQKSCDSLKPGWQMFWRKLTGKYNKKVLSMFENSYDPETYEQNFDQGTGWMEPDNLPRSFSAKYTDPSRILRRDRLLDVGFRR